MLWRDDCFCGASAASVCCQTAASCRTETLDGSVVLYDRLRHKNTQNTVWKLEFNNKTDSFIRNEVQVVKNLQNEGRIQTLKQIYGFFKNAGLKFLCDFLFESLFLFKWNVAEMCYCWNVTQKTLNHIILYSYLIWRTFFKPSGESCEVSFSPGSIQKTGHLMFSYRWAEVWFLLIMFRCFRWIRLSGSLQTPDNLNLGAFSVLYQIPFRNQPV